MAMVQSREGRRLYLGPGGDSTRGGDFGVRAVGAGVSCVPVGCSRGQIVNEIVRRATDRIDAPRRRIALPHARNLAPAASVVLRVGHIARCAAPRPEGEGTLTIGSAHDVRGPNWFEHELEKRMISIRRTPVSRADAQRAERLTPLDRRKTPIDRPRLDPRISVGLAAALLVTGCAKQIPVPGNTFEAQQKVVIELKSNRELRGKIERGSHVDYREGDQVYRAEVSSLSDSSIVLQDLSLVRTDGSFSEVRQRQADARASLGAVIPERRLNRSEIEKVHLLTFDPARSARGLGFWSCAGTVLVLLLSERS